MFYLLLPWTGGPTLACRFDLAVYLFIFLTTTRLNFPPCFQSPFIRHTPNSYFSVYYKNMAEDVNMSVFTAESVTDVPETGSQSKSHDCGDKNDSCLCDEEELKLEKEHFKKIVNAFFYYKLV